MRNTIFLLSVVTLALSASATGRGDESAPRCSDPIRCETAEECRSTNKFYAKRSKKYFALADDEEFGSRLHTDWTRKAVHDQSCALIAKRRYEELRAVEHSNRPVTGAAAPSGAGDGVNCHDFASCHSLAKSYSSQARAKIEENREVYKSDPAQARANEAEIRALSARAEAALAKARRGGKTPAQ